MAYPAKAIANYFLDLASKKGVSLSLMKLLKLLYYANGWHLAIKDKPLIEEPVEAWKYGPVVAPIYHEFKEFGNSEITRFAANRSQEELKRDPSTKPWIDEEDEYTKRLLKKVWDVYGDYSGSQLSTITHNKGTPWDITWNERGGNSSNSFKIDNGLIRDYFIELAHKDATHTSNLND
jgi:uncharacterized phage-associated protein